MTSSQHLRYWLHEPVADTGKTRRKLLSMARWCTQIGYNPGNLNRYMNGVFDLPEPHLSNLTRIAQSFGYVPLTIQETCEHEYKQVGSDADAVYLRCLKCNQTQTRPDLH